MGTPVIARGDTPPVLEFSNHILDLMTFFVEVGVVRNEGATIFLRGYARVYAFGFQGASKPVSVIAKVGDHLLGFG